MDALGVQAQQHSKICSATSVGGSSCLAAQTTALLHGVALASQHLHSTHTSHWVRLHSTLNGVAFAFQLPAPARLIRSGSWIWSQA